MQDAHDALADVRATAEVLQGQIIRYEGVDYIDGDGKVTPAPISRDIHQVAGFLADHGSLDVTQRLRYDPNGEIVFNFGKYIGRPVAKPYTKIASIIIGSSRKSFLHKSNKLFGICLLNMKKALKISPRTLIKFAIYTTLLFFLLAGGDVMNPRQLVLTCLQPTTMFLLMKPVTTVVFILLLRLDSAISGKMVILYSRILFVNNVGDSFVVISQKFFLGNIEIGNAEGAVVPLLVKTLISGPTVIPVN